MLLILSPFLSQKTSSPNSSESLIRLSDRVVFGWLDVPPKEAESLHFFCNQTVLSPVKTMLVPMFPYDNPFFLVMVDSVYTKDVFYKETLLSYLKNKKFETFVYQDAWTDALTKARKKAETLADQCVMILVGSPDFSEKLSFQEMFRYPLFCWINNGESSALNLQYKIVESTGGKVYGTYDNSTLEDMDIKIHAPVPDQKIQFLATIPFLQQYFTTRLIVQTQKNNYTLELNPTVHLVRQINFLFRILFVLLLISSLFVLLELVKKSRKKWKKKKRKQEAKNAKKQFSISWLEDVSKKTPSVRVNKSPFVIGSASNCDYVIPDDAGVSAKHCQIVESKCLFFLFDIQSRNGTFVNEEKILQKQLVDKDKLRIGKTILIFHKSALQYTSDEKVL